MFEPARIKVVQLTPPGRGAVATLLVEGPGAQEAVETRFLTRSGRPLDSYAPQRLVFGHFALGAGPEAAAQPGEEVIVRRHSPESVEIHCHGGLAAVNMIGQALSEQGCPVVPWQAWVARHQADSMTTAARLALTQARTERTALILLDQYQGALRRAIEATREALRNGHPASAGRQLESLLAHARTGQHLVEPWQVVLAGPPNVGKSSLINALLGYRRAIVHSSPGTTRDVVSAVTAIEGWPVELSDTAGLRRSAEALEQTGIELAQQKLAGADLVLLIFDLSQPWSEADQAIAAARPDALVIHNKSDLPVPFGPPRPAGVVTSARTGHGIDTLVRTIAERLVPVVPPPGAAVPFSADQIHRLQRAVEAIRGGEPGRADAALDW